MYIFKDNDVSQKVKTSIFSFLLFKEMENFRPLSKQEKCFSLSFKKKN